MEIGILIPSQQERSSLEKWAERSEHNTILLQDLRELKQSLSERQVQVIIASDRVVTADQVRCWREHVPEIYWIMVTNTPTFAWAEETMLAGACGFSTLPIIPQHMDTIMCHVKILHCQRLQVLFSLGQSETAIDLSKPIESALSYIAQHIAERLTLAAVSREVYLSPSYFSRLFVHKVGLHFNEYVLLQRIEAAKTLLAETHLPIEYIGMKVGFSSASYFSQTFKRLTGRSPRAYRFAPLHRDN